MTQITQRHLIISRRNWLLFSVGLALIVLSFIVMRLDGEPYGFGFLGLTLGPIMLLAGFVVQIFAIMARPDRPADQQGGEDNTQAEDKLAKPKASFVPSGRAQAIAR